MQQKQQNKQGKVRGRGIVLGNNHAVNYYNSNGLLLAHAGLAHNVKTFA